MHTRTLALLLSTCLLSAQAPPATIAGFTPEQAQREQELEKRFDSLLNRANLQDWLKLLSAKPHHVGSPGSREAAEFIAAKFKSWGYQTEIETFYPLFPTPTLRLLEMTAPEKFTAKLSEPAVEGDETSSKASGGLPVYHAYSTDGDVTGQLVYVNYGLPDDYEQLARFGIDVKGKIVIARYGASWRGIKPKVAAEHGAIGCLVYSDPKDDGYWEGDVYPKGGWRNKDSAQRGSVMDMPIHPGDPLTPGYGATKDAKLLPREEVQTITKIPVLPISYADAEPLLRALGGPVAPPSWRGALPFTYHIGPGPAVVHLKVAFEWKRTPAHNVIARLTGSEWPDELVVRGNHHDGWVFGASDPLSAMVAMMEEARVIGELSRSGWRPKRTIIFCAWDGEEPGLLGSTEWAEQHAAELQKHAVAYLNSDLTARGFLSVGGSQSMELLSGQAARDVIDPETKVPVTQRLKARATADGEPLDEEPGIYPLGSGSDYTVFLDHLGIPSLNFGFGGEDSAAGSYHSNYDSYDHVVRFVDPDFQYIFATAKLGGRLILRLADAQVLPYSFSSFTRAVVKYAGEVKKLAEQMRAQTERENTLIQSGALALAADSRTKYVAPEPKEPVPFINFAPLDNAIAKLQASTASLDSLDLSGLPPAQAKAVNQALRSAEQSLLLKDGLPRRPWFKHSIYAPGAYTGYGVKTLPAVREAIELRKWDEAEAQIAETARALRALAGVLDQAAGAAKTAR
jgi:N-acetylated-alpha-linked acidic dipeptidase